MTARGGGPTPTELRNRGLRGVPTYPLGIVKRWHHNLPSLAKERSPVAHVAISCCSSRRPYPIERRRAKRVEHHPTVGVHSARRITLGHVDVHHPSAQAQSLGSEGDERPAGHTACH
jgi:hypothetical protein